MSEIKKVDHTSADQAEEQLHLTHTVLVGYKMALRLWENGWVDFYKPEHIWFSSPIPPLAIYPRPIKAYFNQKSTYT